MSVGVYTNKYNLTKISCVNIMAASEYGLSTCVKHNKTGLIGCILNEDEDDENVLVLLQEQRRSNYSLKEGTIENWPKEDVKSVGSHELQCHKIRSKILNTILPLLESDISETHPFYRLKKIINTKKLREILEAKTIFGGKRRTKRARRHSYKLQRKNRKTRRHRK